MWFKKNKMRNPIREFASSIANIKISSIVALLAAGFDFPGSNSNYKGRDDTFASLISIL
jgi:hypothetical protein